MAFTMAALDLIELGSSAPREPRPCGTGALAAVPKRHDQGRRDGLVEVGVVEQDGGRLAAQFQRDALHGFRSIAHDRLANANRSRERDFGDIGSTQQPGDKEDWTKLLREGPVTAQSLEAQRLCGPDAIEG